MSSILEKINEHQSKNQLQNDISLIEFIETNLKTDNIQNIMNRVAQYGSAVLGKENILEKFMSAVDNLSNDKKEIRQKLQKSIENLEYQKLKCVDEQGQTIRSNFLYNNLNSRLDSLYHDAEQFLSDEYDNPDAGKILENIEPSKYYIIGEQENLNITLHNLYENQLKQKYEDKYTLGTWIIESYQLVTIHLVKNNGIYFFDVYINLFPSKGDAKTINYTSMNDTSQIHALFEDIYIHNSPRVNQIYNRLKMDIHNLAIINWGKSNQLTNNIINKPYYSSLESFYQSYKSNESFHYAYAFYAYFNSMEANNKTWFGMFYIAQAKNMDDEYYEKFYESITSIYPVKLKTLENLRLNLRPHAPNAPPQAEPKSTLNFYNDMFFEIHSKQAFETIIHQNLPIYVHAKTT